MTRTELAAPAPFRVWMLALDSWPDSAALETLSPAERERAQRFRFEHLRRRHLASHVALREALAEFNGEPEASQQFVEGPFGKPALVSQRCAFNMSHSDDVAVIAVAPQGEIGVDVELLRPVKDGLEIARRNFTPAEHQQLLAAPAEQRDLVFMRIWTRKEACLKAVGSGFSIAPACFEAGAETAPRQLAMPTPAGAVRLHVESLPEVGGCVMALAWVDPRGA
jgi:4'-phosphopantetheinyl transferase